MVIDGITHSYGNFQTNAIVEKTSTFIAVQKLCNNQYNYFLYDILSFLCKCIVCELISAQLYFYDCSFMRNNSYYAINQYDLVLKFQNV